MRIPSDSICYILITIGGTITVGNLQLTRGKFLPNFLKPPRCHCVQRMLGSRISAGLIYGGLVPYHLGCWTCSHEVIGSTFSWVAIKGLLVLG